MIKCIGLYGTITFDSIDKMKIYFNDYDFDKMPSVEFENLNNNKTILINSNNLYKAIRFLH